MKYSGQCHCGKLKASFETQKAPQELGVRTCQCDFCRRHGAINISDPEGLTVIEAATEDVFRYRFALRTADFLICKYCGVYIAAVIGADGNIRSTINVVGLRMKEFLLIEEQPMQYGVENIAARVDRRNAKWTPTRFADAALSRSAFGERQG